MLGQPQFQEPHHGLSGVMLLWEWGPASLVCLEQTQNAVWTSRIVQLSG